MSADLSFPAERGHMLPSLIGNVNANTARERARAARVVAANARDADECARILGMLGLDPREGLSREEPGAGDTAE
jgi:hypothetical protein